MFKTESLGDARRRLLPQGRKESSVSIVSGSHKIVCSFVIMSLKDSYYVYES